MSRDRSALRAPSLRRYEDPATSSDPRVRAVVEGLSRVDYAPPPRPEFRAELRAQLVAVTERIVTESAASPANAPSTTSRAATSRAATSRAATSESAAGKVSAPGRSRRSFGRPLGMATAVVAALGLLLGGAVWKSQNSLPGDSLYGLKRTGEDVRLSMTSGSDKGHEYLSLASTRVQEAHDLLGTTSAMASGGGVLAGGVSPQTAKLISDALDSANSDLRDGSSLLNSEAVRSHSSAPLTIMTAWAPSQLSALSALAADVPDSALQQQAKSSWSLVNKANGRAKALKSDVERGCTAAAPAGSGLRPCASTLPSRPANRTATPGLRSKSAPSAPHRQDTSTGSTAGSHPGGSQRTRNAAPTASGAAPSSSAPASGLPIPKLPKISMPKTPVAVDSCGVHASAGGLNLSLGTCSSGS